MNPWQQGQAGNPQQPYYHNIGYGNSAPQSFGPPMPMPTASVGYPTGSFPIPAGGMGYPQAPQGYPQPGSGYPNQQPNQGYHQPNSAQGYPQTAQTGYPPSGYPQPAQYPGQGAPAQPGYPQSSPGYPQTNQHQAHQQHNQYHAHSQNPSHVSSYGEPKKSKKPMTRDEVSYFVELIQNCPILTSKETNASSNKLKDEAWDSLAAVFNAKCGGFPKQKEKLKWDNLKKAARKRTQQIRMNRLKVE